MTQKWSEKQCFEAFQFVHASASTLKRCDRQHGYGNSDADVEHIANCEMLATHLVAGEYWCRACMVMHEESGEALPHADFVTGYYALVATADPKDERWVLLARDLVLALPPCPTIDWKAVQEIKDSLPPLQRALMTDKQHDELLDAIQRPNVDVSTPCPRCQHTRAPTFVLSGLDDLLIELGAM